MKPNSRKHKKSFEYLRELKKKSGLNNQQLAEALGIGLSTVKKHLSSNDRYQAPYYFQFMLECLVIDKIDHEQKEIDRQRKEITETP